MKRSLVAAALTAALVVSGCAAPQQALVPPGEDPNRLAEAIARRGRGDGPEGIDPPGSSLIGDCLKTTVKVSETCALLALLVAYCVAPGQHDSSSPDGGNGFNTIWSDH
jgi:hypothetical protein